MGGGNRHAKGARGPLALEPREVARNELGRRLEKVGNLGDRVAAPLLRLRFAVVGRGEEPRAGARVLARELQIVGKLPSTRTNGGSSDPNNRSPVLLWIVMRGDFMAMQRARGS